MSKTKTKKCGCCASPKRCECCGKCETCGADHWSHQSPIVPGPFPAQPTYPTWPYMDVTFCGTDVRTNVGCQSGTVSEDPGDIPSSSWPQYTVRDTGDVERLT